MAPLTDSRPTSPSTPATVTSALVGSLSTFYQQEIDPLNEDHREIHLRRLIAKLNADEDADK